MKKVLFFLIMFCVQSLFAQRVVITVEMTGKTALTLADMIKFLRQKGYTCMMEFNYDWAAFYYRKILDKKIPDSYALRRLKQAEYPQKRSCKNNLTQAEKLFL